jgi:hypothetical protein
MGRSPAVLDYLHGVLSERAVDAADEPAKDKLTGRQATAAIALQALGVHESLWPLLKHHADPRLRSLLIQRLAANPLNTRVFLDR